MNEQGLEIRYCKYQLDSLSYEKERLKTVVENDASSAVDLEHVRRQLASLQEKTAKMVEENVFVKELMILTNSDCGNLSVNLPISRHDSLIALKFAVASLVNTNRRWSAHIRHEDLVVEEADGKENDLEDSFVIAGWELPTMSMCLCRLGRRIVLPWKETKGSFAPEREYLFGQLELHLLRHQKRGSSRTSSHNHIKTRTKTAASSSSSSSFSPSPSPSSSSLLSSFSCSPSSSSISSCSYSSHTRPTSPRISQPSSPTLASLSLLSGSTSKIQNYFSSSSSSTSPKNNTDSSIKPIISVSEQEELNEEGKRLAEWESLVQCLLLPFVSAPSSIAQCKAMLKKVLQKLEASNAAISECKLVEFRLPSVVAETPRLRMLSQEREHWLLAIDWHASSLLIGLNIKGKKMGVNFGLHVQLSGMHIRGTMRLRAPAYQAEARAIQFEQDPTIDFAVESTATVGGATLPFRQAIENALMTQINKALHKQIRKRMMGQEWVSLFQVKKELSSALSQWSMHAKAFKFDGSDDVEMMTEALESITVAQKLLIATTEAMEAHMDQIKAHLRHREALAFRSNSSDGSVFESGISTSSSSKTLNIRGQSISVNGLESPTENKSAKTIISESGGRDQTKDSEKTVASLTGRNTNHSISQTLPRTAAAEANSPPPPPLPPRPNRSMTLR